MPPKVLREVKQEALNMTAQSYKQYDIASALGISERTIRRANYKYENYGDVEGGIKKQGRKPLLTLEMEDVSLIFTCYSNVLLRLCYL